MSLSYLLYLINPQADVLGLSFFRFPAILDELNDTSIHRLENISTICIGDHAYYDTLNRGSDLLR